MINLPPLHSTKRIEAKAIPAILKSWQIGAIFESRAHTSSNATGELLLQIGQHLIDAKTKTPISAGENLTLQVNSLGERPLLKILNSPVKTDAITLLLRQAIPDNDSIQKLFNQLSLIKTLAPDLSLNKSTAPINLPNSNYTEIKTFIKHISTLIELPLQSDNISSKSIRHFLQQSGFNFENQLANQKIPSKNLKLELFQLKESVKQLLNHADYSGLDNKQASIKNLINDNQLSTLASFILYKIPPADKSLITSLINTPTSFNIDDINESQRFLFQSIKNMSSVKNNQLKQWIQFLPALAELKQLVDQSINTITNHQLVSVQAESDSAFMVLFNLLVAKTPDWIDVFNIQLSKEENNDDEDKHWKVTIQLEMPKLGKIEAKLILVKEKMHAAVTSQSNITHQLVQEHIGILKSALAIAGFDVETISCKQETIKPLGNLPKGHSPLLDDKA